MAEVIVTRVGIQDFRRDLRALGPKFEARVVRAGLRAAGKEFERAAKQLAPVLKKRRKNRRPGALRDAIRVINSKRSTPRKTGSVGVFIGFVRRKNVRRGGPDDAFYGRFLEDGYYPRPPGGKLRGGVRSRALARRRNAARGAPFVQRPFLAPAFRQAQGRALSAFNDRVSARIAALNRERVSA
jgi:HK97 gp10 family phage protein